MEIAPLITDDILQDALLKTKGELLHHFQWGPMYEMSIPGPANSLLDLFMDELSTRHDIDPKELLSFFDEVSTSDIEFLETYYPDSVSITRLITNEVGGSALSILLMHLNALSWVYIKVDGIDHYDVLFEGAGRSRVLEAMVLLYLTDQTPGTYRKYGNFLNPKPMNRKETTLYLDQELKSDYTLELIKKAPFSDIRFE